MRYPSYMQVYQAAKGLNTNYDELVDFLESIETLINPLDIYAQIPATPTMDEIIVKIMTELLSTLALTTKELMHGRRSECDLADMLLLTQTTQRDSSRRYPVPRMSYAG